MAIPSLRKVLPFPATEDYVFRFDVSGISQQVFYNELEIKLNSDTSQVIYKEKKQEFRYQHTMPSETLTNGNQYVATVKVYDNSDVLIGESNPIFFYCFSLPRLKIPTVVDSEVGNQTVLFIGTYEQDEGEILESYRFILYNYNQMEITRSPDIYSDEIQYEFSELESRQKYYIELQISTINGVQTSTGLIEFTPRYIAPRFNSAIELINTHEEASVEVKCNIVRIIGVPDHEPIEYIDGMMDLRENGMWFDEGFRLRGNWTIQLWLKDIVDDSEFFKLLALSGEHIKLKCKNNRINLYKMLDSEYIMQSLLGEFDIDTTDQMVFICIKHIDGLYDFNYKVVEE